MSITFDGLKSMIADYLNRNDLDNQIAVAINIALHRIENSVNFDYMQSRDTVVLSASTDYVSAPTRYKSMIDMYFIDGNNKVKIVHVSERYSTSNTADTGSPREWWDEKDSTRHYYYPIADQNYTLYRTFRAYSSDLASGSSHWILTNYWEILFYGAMIEMLPIVFNFEAIPYWQNRFNEYLVVLKKREDSEASALSSDFIRSSYA